jgi:hypothetical protein
VRMLNHSAPGSRKATVMMVSTGKVSQLGVAAVDPPMASQPGATLPAPPPLKPTPPRQENAELRGSMAGHLPPRAALRHIRFGF